MNNIKQCSKVFLVILNLLLLMPVSAQQSSEIFNLTADALKNKPVEFTKLRWKYQAGDDARWADPNFDDTAWATLEDSALTLDDLPADWSGVHWFRLRLRADDSLKDEQLTLYLDHWGASEIYIDGRLAGRFGTVGATLETEQAFRPNGIPILFVFDKNRSEHSIIVRHSAAALRNTTSPFIRWGIRRVSATFGNNAAGVEMSIIKSADTILERESFLKFEAGNRFGRSGMVLMVGLLFLLLFFFYPTERANLYFSIFALFVVARYFTNYFRAASHLDLMPMALVDVFWYLTWAGFNILLLAFLYAAFAKRIPKYFWIFVAAYTLQLLLNIIFVDLAFEGWLLVALLCFVLFEQTRILIGALVKKMSGAWIVGFGITMFAFLTLYYLLIKIDALLDITIPFPVWTQTIVRQISTFGVTVPIAIYLARNFARINKNLKAQLIKETEYEKEKARLLIVEAENERRAKELEEARQLQFSMLPKNLPHISHLEIAAYMKPATEVGGDYYDFHVSDDGTLTVAIGDATGHGLKAGTMVTVAKTLFKNHAGETDITNIFKKSSRVIKEMNLRGLFMAMTMLKIKDGRLVACAAGMPPMLIFRALNGQVEEIAIRAMPWGSPFNASYQQQELTLSAGDTILLMSDGFPEMFNETGEMLTDGAANKVLRETSQQTPQEIINRLVSVGEQWAGNRPQDDDVTFVVLKIKEND